MDRDASAENRVFTKSQYDQKLLIGGCRACLGDLEKMLLKIENAILRPQIVDFRVFFS